jgi:hypothetical protein
MNADLAGRAAAYRAGLRTPATRPTDPAGRNQRRRGHRPALALLVVVLAVAGMAAGRLSRPADPRAPSAVGEPTSDSPVDQAGSVPAAAGIPQSAPESSWRLWSSQVTRTALPTVPGAGPADPADLSGYAHTPTGALAAAANVVIPTWFDTDDSSWNRLADQQVIWAPGARANLARRRATAFAGAPPAAQPLAIAGFRYVYYREGEASIRLWLRGPVNTLGMIVRLVWAAGDWRVAWDENAADISVLSAQDSFIPWQVS